MEGGIGPTERGVTVSPDMVKNRNLDSYSQEHGFLSTEEFLTAICPKATATVLDIGSGEGNFSKDMMSKRPLWNIISLDLEPKGGKNQVKANFSDLPIASSSVDAVVGTNSLGMYTTSVDSIEKGLSEVNRVLRPGGKMMINVFAPLNTDDLSTVYGSRLDNPQALKKLRRTHFFIYSVDRAHLRGGTLLDDVLKNGFELKAIRKSLTQTDINVYAIEAGKK